MLKLLKKVSFSILGFMILGALTTANASAAAPSIVQTKSQGLTVAGLNNITLTSPVTAGNWIAAAVSTVGSSPFNIILSDNQGHVDSDFGYTGLKWTSPVGTLWVYVKASTSGTYTLTIQRPSGASNGVAHVFELSGVDPTTFNDGAGVGASGNNTTPTGTLPSTTTIATDLLLTVVAVNASTTVITPTTPAGSTSVVNNNKVGTLTSSVFGFAATTTKKYTVAGTLNATGQWRLSSLAVKGTNGPVVAPVNTVKPAVTVVNNTSYLTLTTNNGTWINNPTSYTYNWLRNGVIISGATTATYNTTLGDQGTNVTAVVTAANTAGTVSATSTAVAVPFASSTPAPTISISANPTSITTGNSSTLTWSSTNATSCTSSGAWTGSRATSGTLAVSPTTTSTYTLTCTGTGGNATSSAVVTVTAGTPAPTVTFSASPASITSGQSSTLTWSTTNATSCTSSGAWTGSRATSGTLVVSPTTTSNYTLTCTGAGGTTPSTVTVTVSAGTPAPTVTISANPTSITSGQSSTLTWSSTNATSCTGSGAWTGGSATSGTLAVTPTVTSTYTLTCTGAGGSGASSATVTVGTAGGSDPATGAHGMAYHISQQATGSVLSVPAMTTQSTGSTILSFVGKGSIYNLAPTTDNKGNTYTQLGTIHEYTRWPGEGSTVYVSPSVTGGANHIVSEIDTNTWDEVTVAAVEVKNGGVVKDIKWNEVLNSQIQTTQSVTTTGPATLVAVWLGDDSSSEVSNPVPGNGFTRIEVNGGATETVQMAIATRDVSAAGTYNMSWNTTPTQGAQLYLIAVQKNP